MYNFLLTTFISLNRFGTKYYGNVFSFLSPNEYGRLLMYLYATVCPFQVSGHLMEGYSVDTQYFSKIPSFG